MNILNKKTGFTLIELLVVVAIIGLLASVVLASLNSARAKARDARRRAELYELTNALELYYSQYGSYPISTSNCAGQSSDAWCRDSQGSDWIPGLSEFISMPHNIQPLAAPGWVYHYYGNANQYWLMTKLHSVAPDTCGSGTPILWLDGLTDWCMTNPVNNNAVYVRAQR